jgi:hypothetical protein
MDLGQVLAREDELVGRTITIAGTLERAVTWCDGCCGPVMGELAVEQDSPHVQVSLGGWWCFAGANGVTECALPRDGRRITVRGQLDRVRFGKPGDLVLYKPKLCEGP